jgi:heme-degrading monooxygenase HmoA
MIARLWRGRASNAAKADAYLRHFTGTVVPELEDLQGHRGAWLLRREVDGRTEFTALTLWESRQSIEAFTGPDISKSVVEPEARAVLDEFDDFASHYDVVAASGLRSSSN